MALFDPYRAGQASRPFAVREVATLQPLHWLAHGWRDLLACPLPGLVHGAAFTHAWDVLFVVDRVGTDFASAAYRDAVAPGCGDELELVASRGRFAAYRWVMRRTVDTR